MQSPSFLKPMTLESWLWITWVRAWTCVARTRNIRDGTKEQSWSSHSAECPATASVNPPSASWSIDQESSLVNLCEATDHQGWRTLPWGNTSCLLWGCQPADCQSCQLQKKLHSRDFPFGWKHSLLCKVWVISCQKMHRKFRVTSLNLHS